MDELRGFGLPKDTVPVKPFNFKVYRDLDKIPKHGAAILSAYEKSVTARTDEYEYREVTRQFLEENKIRHDEILFNMPMGERIVVNDRKPSGLDMAVAINIDRDKFDIPDICRQR